MNFIPAFSQIAVENQYRNTVEYRKFTRQLVHSSLRQIFSTLAPGMTTSVVVKCGDGHFRRAIFGLGPYIGDYPEQCLLASIVQGWCAKFVFRILSCLKTLESWLVQPLLTGAFRFHLVTPNRIQEKLCPDLLTIRWLLRNILSSRHYGKNMGLSETW